MPFLTGLTVYCIELDKTPQYVDNLTRNKIFGGIMRKKLLALCLILLALGSFVFADDAKVMPAMVGRFYVAPTFAFVPGAYNGDGKYTSISGDSPTLFNLGFAVEFGVLDWITAAVQWVPGWTIFSDVKSLAPAAYQALPINFDSNGVADIFAGAKIQIIGEKAPVASDMFRFAAALGVIIPMPGPDFSKEAGNIAGTKDATINSMDRHAFALGARLYFDWIINKMFFLNLYNETIIYLGDGDFKGHGLDTASAIGGLGNGKVSYKYKLTFEIEPVFTMPLAEGINFSAGLPVNFVYKPAPGLSPYNAMYFPNSNYKDDSYVLSLRPNASVFLTKTPLPLEFKLIYSLPILGQNNIAQHAIQLQIRAYFALPGAER